MSDEKKTSNHSVGKKNSSNHTSSKANRLTRVNTVTLASGLLEALEDLEHMDARNVLNIVALTFGLKLVPLNSETVFKERNTPKNGQDQSKSKPQPKRKGGKDKTEPVKAKGAKAPVAATFDKKDVEWLNLQSQITFQGNQITSSETPEATESARAARRVLVEQAKILKKNLQKKHLSWGKDN